MLAVRATFAIDHIVCTFFIVDQITIVLIPILRVLVDVVVIAALMLAGLRLFQRPIVEQLKAMGQALHLIAVVLELLTDLTRARLQLPFEARFEQLREVGLRLGALRLR